MTTAETVFSALTVPLPLFLNVYWFYLMVRKLVRESSKGKTEKTE